MPNKPQVGTHDALEAILQPDGLVLEWQQSECKFNETSLRIQQETFRRFNSTPDEWLFYLGFCPEETNFTESLRFWHHFTSAFVKKLTLTPELEELRHRLTIDLPDDFLQSCYNHAPLFQGVENLSLDFLHEVWGNLNKTFQTLIRKYDGTVEKFCHALRPNLQLAGRIFFHLVENKKGASAPFAFLATYSTKTDEIGNTRHVPLKNALREYEGDKTKMLELLTTVYKAARESSFISEMIDTGRIFHPLSMSSEDALVFLKEVPVYEDSGICCRIPNWWRAKSTRVTMTINIGDKKPSLLGFDALVQCSPQLTVDGEAISLVEAEKLLTEAQGLVLIKNRWVEVDRDKLQKTLEAYQNAQSLLKEGLSMQEAMQLMLNPDSNPQIASDGANVSFGSWFIEITRKLTNPKLVLEVNPTFDFKAVLRPYQKLGLNWLAFLDSLGFGACLADDMGLGKTIQVLAFLNYIQKKKTAPSLLVLPASLLGNWRDEIKRFFPTLKMHIHHASAIGSKSSKAIPEDELASRDLVITTYAMVQRNDWLNNYKWHYVILDEAQAIKNPGTKQTRAVKKIPCVNRMILTGTPVENRLSDLWSLFDFLNPGLLGSKNEFKKFATELKSSDEGYERLRRVVSPYILRRLKTDKSIISDLPDKVEMKTYSELAPEQIIIYRDLVADMTKAFTELEGIQRRGIILSSLIKFKQICNHPDQYTGNKSFKASESGKFMRLKEICETIYAKREHVLIFTQFQEITDALDRFLSDIFQHPGLVIHGAVPVKKRQSLVKDFQTSRNYIPYMVLSVKAAGVGLNLTRANHVIHFDRWWNPAVENQATDRAFRIGQTRSVIVHKFVTKGTIEEKIDLMLEEKNALSEQLIHSSGENWITEMSNDQLKDLFSLSL